MKETVLKIEEKLSKPLKDVTTEELTQLIEELEKEKIELKKNKKYGLVWEEQEEEAEKYLLNNYPLLKEVKKREIITDKDKPMNLLIEGENLHVLTTLLHTHNKKIEVIIIEPPFNHGNGQFIFNGKKVSKEDPWIRSKWISFMNRRLILSKELLSNNGVIIVAIDDFHRGDLEFLLKQHFPNYIGEIIWDKRTQRVNDYGLSSSHEYLLIASNSEFTGFNLIQKSNYLKINNKIKSLISKKDQYCIPELLLKELKKVTGLSTKEIEKQYPQFFVKYTEDVIQKEFDRWLLSENIPKGESAYNKIDFEKEDVYQGISLSKHDKNGYHYDIIHPITNEPCSKPFNGWKMPKETFDKWHNEGIILFGETHETQPRKKLFLNENSKEQLKSVISLAKTGTSELSLMGFKGKYPFAKPTDLIKHLLSALNNDIIVLDFFAGSGTTGHTVLELNKEDGGTRQFILVNNNEDDVCEKITYERLERVINGYTTPKGKKVKGLGGNLKYFQTDYLSKNLYHEDFKFILADKIKDVIKIKEDCFIPHLETEEFQIYKNPQKIIAFYSSFFINPSTLFIIEKEILSLNKDSRTLYLLILESGNYALPYEVQQMMEKGIDVKLLTNVINQSY